MDVAIAAFFALPGAVTAVLVEDVLQFPKVLVWVLVTLLAGLLGPLALRAQRGSELAGRSLPPLLQVYAAHRRSLLDVVVSAAVTAAKKKADAAAVDVVRHGWDPDTFAYALQGHLLTMSGHAASAETAEELAGRVRAAWSLPGDEDRIRALLILAAEHGAESFIDDARHRGPTGDERDGGKAWLLGLVDDAVAKVREKAWTLPLLRYRVQLTIAVLLAYGEAQSDLAELETKLAAIAAEGGDAALQMTKIISACVRSKVLWGTVSEMGQSPPSLQLALESGLVVPAEE
jgi:hypothetical protein